MSQPVNHNKYQHEGTGKRRERRNEVKEERGVRESREEMKSNERMWRRDDMR